MKDFLKDTLSVWTGVIAILGFVFYMNDRTFDRLDERTDKIESKLDERTDKIESKLDERTDKIESKLDNYQKEMTRRYDDLFKISVFKQNK